MKNNGDYFLYKRIVTYWMTLDNDNYCRFT